MLCLMRGTVGLGRAPFVDFKKRFPYVLEKRYKAVPEVQGASTMFS